MPQNETPSLRVSEFTGTLKIGGVFSLVELRRGTASIPSCIEKSRYLGEYRTFSLQFSKMPHSLQFCRSTFAAGLQSPRAKVRIAPKNG